MKSFMPMPQRMILWRCPDCGKEKVTMELIPPWIHTCFPFVFGKRKAPVCSECKKEMLQVRIFY